MLSYIATVSLFSIIYAYFGYPLVLLYLKSKGGHARVTGLEPSSYSIIISARNESAHIRAKIENTLDLDWYDGKKIRDVLLNSKEVEVVIADDASDDGTDKIVSEYAASGVKISRLSVRGGKEVAQKRAVEMSTGEIIIFTDAKVMISHDIILKARAYFSNPKVGAISSIDNVIDESGESGEGAYVRYEMKVRELESEVASLVGLSGSCFLVRREVAKAIRDNLASDFFCASEAVRNGQRSILAKDIIGTYKAVTDSSKEYERKIRTVVRGMTALFAQTEVFDMSKYGFFTFQVISHKIYRWLIPWFFILLFISSMFIRHCSCFWGMVFWAQLVLIGLALLGYYKQDMRKFALVRIPLFFVLSNTAILVASIRLLKGESVVLWDPSSKG